MKTKPNEPCPCGSKNKFKNCCWVVHQVQRQVAIEDLRAKRGPDACFLFPNKSKQLPVGTL